MAGEGIVIEGDVVSMDIGTGPGQVAAGDRLEELRARVEALQTTVQSQQSDVVSVQAQLDAMDSPQCPSGYAHDTSRTDIVLCTHDHADHIDPDGIPIIAAQSPSAHFVVPECVREKLRNFGIDDGRIHTMKGDDELGIEGIHIHAVPAKHEEFDKHPQKGYPYLSYVINIDCISLFHAGDTIPYPGQVEHVKKHRIDLAFLPVNGRDEFRHKLDFEGNFTCDEAVRFALDIKAGLTIPMHYDMFTINTADINEFRRTADKHNLRYHIMEHAGSFKFQREKQYGTQR